MNHTYSEKIKLTDNLTIVGLGKNFGKRKVVNDVSLCVNKGEIIGLLGPNGAGKTTCFYMITGLIKADRGRIFYSGKDITKLPMYQRARLGIGYLPQETSIFRGMTIWQNIYSIVEINEKKESLRKKRTEELLSELNILHLKDSAAVTLSGGERRRVEIARALASNPSFILLDEPFSGIDPLAVADISYLIKYLKKRNIGVLITDHQVRETLSIVDKAIIIHEGRVLFEGMPKDVLEDKNVRCVYLGERFSH